MQTLTLQDPNLRPMCSFTLHESLIAGLRSTGAFSGDVIDARAADQLDRWADASDNPTGQKANLVRCVAALARVSDLRIGDQPAGEEGGFWGDATG